MGSYFSSMANEEQHLDPVSDSDDDLFQNIESDDLSEHYLVIILRQLIDSGEIHLLSHNETRDGQLPKISKGPNMEKLKVSQSAVLDIEVNFKKNEISTGDGAV